MASIAMVSIVCRDGIGLVSAIADHLFSAGINLRDTTFAALGKGAEFTAICELPEGLTVAGLEAGLAPLRACGRADPHRQYDFCLAPALMGRITYRIEGRGGDQFGLIARLSEIFA